MAQTISALAFFERNVEKNGLDLAFMRARQLYIRKPFRRREIGRVDVGDRPTKFQPGAQKTPQHPERLPMNALIGGIIAQQTANFIA